MLKWFLTGPDKPRIQDKAVVKKMYHTARVQAVTAMILGYGMYYVMRMTLGVAKKPMLQDGFTPTELGMMGAGMLVAIAIGKCANGFIADHCNIKKIVPLGLLGAAIVNAILGMSNTTWVFIVLWAVNGVFQSMGSAPCIVSLSQWFAKSQLATYYGVFSIAHYVGEGATYLGTSMIIVALGWHAAFFVPGVACIVLAFIMYRFMRDRPETYGLPSANEFEGEVAQEKKEQKKQEKAAKPKKEKKPKPKKEKKPKPPKEPDLTLPLFHLELGRHLPAGSEGLRPRDGRQYHVALANPRRCRFLLLRHHLR